MNFDVSCQYAHQNVDESVSLGTLPPENVLRAFDEFDWRGQVVEANRLQGISPTFSVEEPPEKRLIWVSGYGEPEKINFVSEYTVRCLKKMLFGMIERERAIEIGSTETFTKDEARKAIELFVTKSENELCLLYKRGRTNSTD